MRTAPRLPSILLLAVGCGGAAPTARPAVERGIPVATFIDIYVELRQAAAVPDAADPGDFATRKREILDRHGITEEELRDFAERQGADIPAMAEVWETIRDRIAARDSTGTDGL